MQVGGGWREKAPFPLRWWEDLNGEGADASTGDVIGVVEIAGIYETRYGGVFENLC